MGQSWISFRVIDFIPSYWAMYWRQTAKISPQIGLTFFLQSRAIIILRKCHFILVFYSQKFESKVRIGGLRWNHQVCSRLFCRNSACVGNRSQICTLVVRVATSIVSNTLRPLWNNFDQFLGFLVNLFISWMLRRFFHRTVKNVHFFFLFMQILKQLSHFLGCERLHGCKFLSRRVRSLHLINPIWRFFLSRIAYLMVRHNVVMNSVFTDWDARFWSNICAMSLLWLSTHLIIVERNVAKSVLRLWTVYFVGIIFEDLVQIVTHIYIENQIWISWSLWLFTFASFSNLISLNVVLFTSWNQKQLLNIVIFKTDSSCCLLLVFGPIICRQIRFQHLVL